MRNINNQLAGTLLVIAILFCSCNKDENGDIRQAKVTTLKASVSATTPATKTQHEFSDNTLKVRWSKGDEIAVSDGKELYKFSQTGEISDDGHSALFSSESTVSFEEGEIIAVYPCTTDLTYDLTNQTGKVDKLFQTDLLLARAKVTTTAVEDLAFMPLCAVIRFPKDTLVTDEDFTGEMKMTISGENVGGKIIISKSGGIDVQKTDISIPVTISNGRFAEDTYLVFVPREKTGTYSYILSTDREDIYSFKIENITTTSIYNAKSIFTGFIYFEDANFKYQCQKYDKNGDGEISIAEARQVKEMWLFVSASAPIVSLRGIKQFCNITEFRIQEASFRPNNSGGVKNINLSYNCNLERVILGNSEGIMEQLDVSGCFSLKLLQCWGHKLTTLDLSKNKKLEQLQCDNNNLTSLDLSNNDNLIYASFSKNMISTINLLNLKKLRSLYCGSNSLSEIDLSDCTEINDISCTDNQLTELNLNNNVKLAYIECYNNQIEKLDLSNNKDLVKILCYKNKLSTLNISSCNNLINLQCYENNLTQLDLTNKTKLETLDCNSNQITQLDLNDCISLKELNCAINGLASLDLSKNVLLTDLICSYNTLENLDLSNLSSLANLYCHFNKLDQLIVNKNTALYRLNCSNNQLSSLNIDDNSSLFSLYCSNNQLTFFDVSKNQSIQTLEIDSNKLTSLKTNGSKSLSWVSCTNNNLTSLDLSNNSGLYFLKCFGNKLSSLDISRTDMEVLYAWPQTGTLSKLWVKKGRSTRYRYNNGDYINPADYGTEVIEVD